MPIKSELTVMFESPFWIGIYERYADGLYEVCKITFGAEPKDYDVYSFFLQNQSKLKFSLPQKTEIAEARKINQKRMQREINKQLQNKGIGTKAQQALKLRREQNKLERKSKLREKKQAEKELKYALKREKKKTNR